MVVLVINCGSSSIKYQVWDGERQLAGGIVERIGLPGARVHHTLAGGRPVTREAAVPDHREGMAVVLELLAGPEEGCLQDLRAIEAVGHRVTHGGAVFAGAVLIDETVKGLIRDLARLAPLHNPPNLTGIEVCEDLLPGVPQVAVFDTAFHQTMPPEAFLYSIPYELYERHGIRKYGFHGTSHSYVAGRAAALAGCPLDGLKVVTCHLGNGASVTAVAGGKSVDTSMGFTPLEGLTMGTRCGDLDPAVVTFLMQVEDLSREAVEALLNQRSGVLGISGLSSDFRDLERAAAGGHTRAGLALKVFARDVKRYIGAYAAVMGGLDVLVFTAGLGENSPLMRQMICQGLDFLGVELDAKANQAIGKETRISTAASRCQAWVIPTNEELVIARETRRLVAAKSLDTAGKLYV